MADTKISIYWQVCNTIFIFQAVIETKLLSRLCERKHTSLVSSLVGDYSRQCRNRTCGVIFIVKFE